MGSGGGRLVLGTCCKGKTAVRPYLLVGMFPNF